MFKSILKTVTLIVSILVGIAAAQAQGTSSGEVALFLTIKTQPGERDALVALWDEHLMARAARDASHVSYVLALDMQDPDTVHITEVYATRAAFEANSRSDWFATYMAKVRPLLAGEPGFAMARPHWVK